MNLEFKENLFRFVFPTALLWSFFILLDNSPSLDIFFIENTKNQSLFWVVLFIGVAVIINALSSFLINLIIKKYLHNFNIPEKELVYWRKVSEESKDGKSMLVERKLDRRWDFFVAHLNSLLVTYIFTIYYIFTNFKLENIYYFSSLFILNFILIYLTGRGFESIKYFEEYFVKKQF